MKPAARLVKRRTDGGPHDSPAAPARGRHKGRILCVDNRASCNLAALLLRRDGYEVVNANSLPRALQPADGEPFDLYLVNHELLCGAGKEFYEKACGAVPSVPLLFYTTVTYPFSPRSADQSGAEGGPVPVTEVALAVCRALGGKAGSSTGTAQQFVEHQVGKR